MPDVTRLGKKSDRQLKSFEVDTWGCAWDTHVGSTFPPFYVAVELIKRTLRLWAHRYEMAQKKIISILFW